ncbi:SH3 and cysteine-rich domain-containing protein [Anabarilius grahami]|uniref:SH3 and cysteine-rich domain-containing protein n=1 Tax=Anabarilius grahami TaxID=495550 RepID=A0A3N0YGE7_ANAGA|nr:SH3 and cysteine-rich domain-containing protein [Anabarilius grahami]
MNIVRFSVYGNLLRLKRSLTFIRSKSVENFFQRSQIDAYLPTALFPSPLLPNGPANGSNSAAMPSPSISFSAPSRPAPFGVQPWPVQTHCFLEHVFRRPTSCNLCKHIIAGQFYVKTAVSVNIRGWGLWLM